MNYGDESGAMSPGFFYYKHVNGTADKKVQFGGHGTTRTGISAHLGQLNLCYGDGLEENDGHYRCLGMGSINDGDDRPQRLPPGNY